MATIRGAGVSRRDYGPPIVIGPTLARWGSIIAGAVAGIGTFLLLSTLWSALAAESEIDFVNDNLEWFNVVSAVLALGLAGFLAGYLSGLRGIGPGAVNGLSAWGLFVTVTLLVGDPTAAARVDQPLTTEVIEQNTAQWEAFWAILAGMVVAVALGALGGMMTRSRELFETGEHRAEERAEEREPLDLTGEERRASYRTPTPGA